MYVLLLSGGEKALAQSIAYLRDSSGDQIQDTSMPRWLCNKSVLLSTSSSVAYSMSVQVLGEDYSQKHDRQTTSRVEVAIALLCWSSAEDQLQSTG